MFEHIQKGVPDPMFVLKDRADNDSYAGKVDLGVGIYRNATGLYHEFESVKMAKHELYQNDPGHDYEVTTGNVDFLRHAASIVFGEKSKQQKQGLIASVQTISGTGACHLAALFIAKNVSPRPKVFVGVPTWGNYKPLFNLAGLEVQEYAHYDSSARKLDLNAALNAINTAPDGSIFILQGCCHNPTGADPTQEEWRIIANAMRAKNHLPFLDFAYQGLGEGLEQDAFSARLFASLGIETIVCQSFSKNFALYGERCGALHIIAKSPSAAANIHDQLRCLIRWEISSSPAFGARLVSIIQGSVVLKANWANELDDMRTRLQCNRRTLYGLLTESRTPGNWEHILEEKGLFSFLRLNPDQCRRLTEKYHIYLPPKGRINVSGLNESNVEIVARAIDETVRWKANRDAEPIAVRL